MRVFFIGFMGVGKTTWAKALANALGLDFYDLDTRVEAVCHAKIPQIFQRHGEKYFREVENKVLTDLLRADDYVLACGGGTPCFFNNMDMLLLYGTTIYLRMDVNSLCDRLLRLGGTRPLLSNLSAAALPDAVARMLAERERYYCRATFTVDAAHCSLGELTRLCR